MKSGSKKGWKSLLPLRLSRASTRFCLFPKVRSASQTSGNVPVYLNVYDLTPINGYMYWAGLGIFHTGVEVHGVEYAFGAHDYPTSGVFEVEPRQCPGFRFRKSIFMGTTCLDPLQVREFMEMQSLNYNGDTYHLIMKNCNHFCQDICYKLTGNTIPKWVNRLARIGSLCNCLLPEALKRNAVQHDPDSQAEDGEKKEVDQRFQLSIFDIDASEAVLRLVPFLTFSLQRVPFALGIEEVWPHSYKRHLRILGLLKKNKPDSFRDLFLQRESLLSLQYHSVGRRQSTVSYKLLTDTKGIP